MNEQARIEYEILELKRNKMNIEINSTQSKREYYIDIVIPTSIIDPQIYNREISFVLYLRSDKYPIMPPRLYCTTIFCFPQIADGRDILNNVINGYWNQDMKLVSLLELIPQFIKEYSTRRDMIFIGAYYLDEKYDMRLIEESNFNIKPVKENILIKGKWTKFPRVLLISDLFFCLFDPDKKNKNKISLVFWASINSIISIKKILVNKMVVIHWNQKDPNNPYEMNLSIDKGEEIVELLLNNIKQFGLNYNVTKEIKGQPPKEIEPEEYSGSGRSGGNSNRIGEGIGDVDGGNEEENNEEMTIEKLEEEIAQLEKTKEQDKTSGANPDAIQMLYNYYDNAENYYNSTNKGDQAKVYMIKKEKLIAAYNSKNNAQ